MEVSGQLHTLAALPPGKGCQLDRRLGGPQSRSGRGGEEKNFQHSPGNEPRSSDRPPVASRYTDWAIAAHQYPELISQYGLVYEMLIGEIDCSLCRAWDHVQLLGQSLKRVYIQGYASKLTDRCSRTETSGKPTSHADPGLIIHYVTPSSISVAVQHTWYEAQGLCRKTKQNFQNWDAWGEFGEKRDPW
jgi:hypothetical protein